MKELVGRSALHEEHLARGAVMDARAGWCVPVRYRSLEEEVRAARAGVIVAECCGETVLDLAGRAVPEAAARLGVAGISAGTAGPIALEGDRRGRWARLTRDQARLRLAAGAAAAGAAFASIGGCLHVTDLTSGLTTLLLVGPRGPDLLARLVRLDLDPRAFTDRRLALTAAAGIPVEILRWDRGALPVYEVTVGRDVAGYFWDSLFHAGEAGEDLGLTCAGAETLAALEA
jgi:glycine cleavage system aminomethyltransferase T